MKNQQNQTQIKLRPCPFCGGRAKMTAEGGDRWVLCTKCNSSSGVFESERDAARAWNDRSEIAFDQKEQGMLYLALVSSSTAALVNLNLRNDLIIKLATILGGAK